MDLQREGLANNRDEWRIDAEAKSIHKHLKRKTENQLMLRTLNQCIRVKAVCGVDSNSCFAEVLQCSRPAATALSLPRSRPPLQALPNTLVPRNFHGAGLVQRLIMDLHARLDVPDRIRRRDEWLCTT